MKRRDFLKLGVAGGVVAAAGCAAREASKESEEEAVTTSVNGFEFDEVTIAELQASMADGSETAASITQKYLDRIKEIDGQGPTLGSVIEINPDAMKIAEELDKTPQSGERGPMHGIPILIKDNIDTGDEMMTTAGSLAMVGHYAEQDSFVAARLRAAGAVILGKTNLSEWANFRSTHSSSGWSGRGGQCKNPYALDRNPCGSSAGSGAATSGNLCAVAVGTETDGSIVCPSTTCGIVGIKPTLGMVSRTGIIPIAHSQDTAGPMARTVTDAAILLNALKGRDDNDPLQLGYQSEAGYTRTLDKGGMKDARIGVGRQFFGYNDHVDKIMEEAIAAMKGLGAEIIDPADMESYGKYDDSEFEVLLYEFKADLNKYMANTGPEIEAKSLEDLIRINEQMKDTAMPFFGQEIFHMAQEKGPLTDKKYKDALAKNLRLSREEGIDKTMDEHNLDAIIGPTGSPGWKTDHLNGDHFTGASSSPAAVSGYPNITVPAGFVGGMPVGISFFGRAWSEPVLIQLAYAFEQETQVRKAPKFLSTAESS